MSLNSVVLRWIIILVIVIIILIIIVCNIKPMKEFEKTLEEKYFYSNYVGASYSSEEDYEEGYFENVCYQHQQSNCKECEEALKKEKQITETESIDEIYHTDF